MYAIFSALGFAGDTSPASHPIYHVAPTRGLWARVRQVVFGWRPQCSYEQMAQMFAHNPNDRRNS